jgi:hypothetical protein
MGTANRSPTTRQLEIRIDSADDGEIDEFMIHVIPKFIGEGIPLIARRRRTVPLRLISCTKFIDGVVKLHYTARK